MDIKTGFVVFTLLAGCIAYPASPASDEDASTFFDRIVNGTVAPIGSHPHIVALSTGYLVRTLLCGGSLISQRAILTAAHCVDAVYSAGTLSSSLLARVGTNSWNSGGATYSIARNVTHPNYVEATIKNDIALLFTNTPVALSNLVQIVHLSLSFVPAGVFSRVAGWGRIGDGGPITVDLMQLWVTTVDGQECVERVNAAAIQFETPAHTEPHIELCAFYAPQFGTCHSDSGSPLIREDNGHQIGIVSWGFPCARGVPDIFVRVSAYQTWILQNLIY